MVEGGDPREERQVVGSRTGARLRTVQSPQQILRMDQGSSFLNSPSKLSEGLGRDGL